ncbi:MAG: hypothetical protein IT566_11405 [Rhodospirillaceae bacterium]|nr:hypothetical protein [Rhodospirillaceae bacterium]
MRPPFPSLLPICAAALVTFHAAGAMAAAKDETYSAYAAQNQVTDAILSRDGTTFATFATERGKTMLRGWRITGNDATPVGRIELKDLRTPTRTRAQYPYNEINKDFASLKKSFALSPSGDRIARLDCGHAEGGFDACERLIVMDWRGKALASLKDTKKDLAIVPGTRPCGIAFSPDGQRLYVCTENALVGFGANNTITYHDEFSRIYAFDGQLKRIQEIALGPTSRSPGAFPGRAQIDGFSISSDNTMLASGYAYATTNKTGSGLENETPFDKSGGIQVWRINLATNRIEYHYAPHRPANAKHHADTGNYLSEGMHLSRATAVGSHLLMGGDGLSPEWEGQVFGEAVKAKKPPRAYVGQSQFNAVSDDGRILFSYDIRPAWRIVGPGAGPVLVEQREYAGRLEKDETLFATGFLPGAYNTIAITKRRVIAHDAPADALTATANRYAKAVDLIETGFAEAGVKELKDIISTMPPEWADAARAQLGFLSRGVAAGERELPISHLGEVLRHAAVTFQMRYNQGAAFSDLQRAIDLWMNFGIYAAQAGNPIVARQAADKLEPLIPEFAAKAPADSNRDTFNSVPFMLRGAAIAIEKSSDSAYDYLLANGGLKDVASVIVYMHPAAFRPLYANLTKLAYLTESKVDELEASLKRTPPPKAPVPYPDVDGKLIPALTVYAPGAMTGPGPSASSHAVPIESSGTPPPAAAPGGQVLD